MRVAKGRCLRLCRPPAPGAEHGKEFWLSEASLSYRQLLRLPDVRELLLAACLSRLAERMFMLAIILHALDRFHSAALAGWVAFCSLAPGMMISPLAGALLDRVGASRGIVVDMAASATLLAVLVTLDLVGAASLPLLLALVALYSLTSPLSAAGIRTLIPRLVPERALHRGNALDTGTYALIDVLGPLVAGVLSGLAGTDVAMLVIAALYVTASVSVAPLARREPRRTESRSRSMLREAVGGVAYVTRHPALRGLAVSYALYQVSWGILIVAVPVFTARELSAGPTADAVVGALWAASGICAALGALLAGRMRLLERERRFVVAGTLATALAIYPLSAHPGLPGLAVGLSLVGFLAGPVDVGLLTLRQRCTEPDWLGRVLAISMSLNMSGLPLGTALGGLLVTRSLSAALAAAAMASLLSALGAHVLIPARSRQSGS